MLHNEEDIIFTFIQHMRFTIDKLNVRIPLLLERIPSRNFRGLLLRHTISI